MPYGTEMLPPEHIPERLEHNISEVGAPLCSLFTIAKIWIPPRCLYKIKKQKVLYIYKGLLFFYIKHEILPFAAK